MSSMDTAYNERQIERLAELLADKCNEVASAIGKIHGAASIMHEWPERQADERRHIANAQNFHRDATVMLADMTSLLCCLRGCIDTNNAIAKAEAPEVAA